jgi:superfamily II DNA/RNA helicase
MVQFQDLSVPDSVKAALERKGWTQPTPIQEAAIPVLLQGNDLIGQAQTGTGKTGAFGIPAIAASVGRGRRGRLQVLVLVPTRELAVQVAKDLNDLGRESDVHAFAVYGGVGMAQQEALLRKDRHAILVATPGRLLDHLQQGTADLRGVEMVVLDEADRMLDMGFVRDVERILSQTPRERQTMLFSATMPPEIETLGRRHLVNPARISVSEDQLAAPEAHQFVVHLAQEQKIPGVLYLLERENPERIILFRRTRGHVQRTLRKLKGSGVAAVGLHGDLSQNQRERSLSAFRAGEAQVLVATDVAARGLDIPEVTHVVNVDCPNVPEAYVHRIGRTARAGRSGRTFLFVTPDDRAEFRAIERLVDQTLVPWELPADLKPEPPAPVAPGSYGGHPQRAQVGTAPRAPPRGRGNFQGRNSGRGGRGYARGYGRGYGEASWAAQGRGSPEPRFHDSPRAAEGRPSSAGFQGHQGGRAPREGSGHSTGRGHPVENRQGFHASGGSQRGRSGYGNRRSFRRGRPY